MVCDVAHPKYTGEPTIMAAAAGDFVRPRLAPAGLGFITLFFGVGQFLGPALGGYLGVVGVNGDF